MTAREVLDQIEQRASKATPGPWKPTLDSPAAYPFVWAPEEGQEYTNPGAVFIAQSYRDDSNAMADPEFIAHARTDVPRLVAALRAVLDLHRSQAWGHGQVCRECDRPYPCTTVRGVTGALGAMDEPP